MTPQLTPQQSLLKSLGFIHHSTDEVSQQSMYSGHGLGFPLPPEEDSPVKILAHILEADRARHRNELRRALETVIGPLAKI